MGKTTESFAAKVKRIAATVPAAGRFGDNKVFIHSVWAWGRFGHEMSLDAFKLLLIECNRVGSLELSRADMVEAMDAHCVKTSNTHHMGATWNFVRI